MVARWDAPVVSCKQGHMHARTIGIGSRKGGVGKSTTAIHLAAAMARPDAPVLVIDGDSLRPLTAWSAGGKLPADVWVMDEQRAARTGAARDAAVVILDLAGGDVDALAGVVGDLDVLVVPSTPDALALSAAVLTLRALPPGVLAGVLLTMVPPRPSRAGDVAADTLTGAGVSVLDTRIPRLSAVADAAAVGCLVGDLPGERAARAATTYTALGREIEQWLSTPRAK